MSPIHPPSEGAGSDPQKTVGDREFAIDKLRTEIGLVGKVIGAADEKPGNIAFLVLVFCFLAFVLVVPALPDDLAGKLTTGLISIISLALGYLFGKKQ